MYECSESWRCYCKAQYKPIFCQYCAILVAADSLNCDNNNGLQTATTHAVECIVLMQDIPELFNQSWSISVKREVKPICKPTSNKRCFTYYKTL